MKAAWRQKKLREKRKGKTEFSLVISNEKKSKLRTLSNKKGKTLNEALEELIDDEVARQKEHQQELLEAKKVLQQRLETVREAHKVNVNEVELRRSQVPSATLLKGARASDRFLEHLGVNFQRRAPVQCLARPRVQ